jgi:hypothetical protein
MTTETRWQTRYINEDDNFFGCVDKNNYWFDSGRNFGACMQWCRYESGNFDEMTMEEELDWFFDEGHKQGFSIIHGSLLKQLFTTGIIK